MQSKLLERLNQISRKWVISLKITIVVPVKDGSISLESGAGLVPSFVEPWLEFPWKHPASYIVPFSLNPRIHPYHKRSLEHMDIQGHAAPLPTAMSRTQSVFGG